MASTDDVTVPATHHGTLTSRDGTTISWSKEGSGPPLVMIECVGASRRTTPQPTLPAALARHFTVFRYDRRGKGESGNTLPFALEREFEDLAAVVALADGPADVYGFSSGGTLALRSAAAGVPIRRLALLEPPLGDEPDPKQLQLQEFERRLAMDPLDAQRWFNVEIVGVPAEILDQMPPPEDEAIRNIPSIGHEFAFLADSTPARFAGVRQPTLLVASDKTAPVIYDYAEKLVDAMPHASRLILEGEWHGVPDAALAAALASFLRAEDVLNSV